MLSFSRLSPEQVDWDHLNAFSDRTIFQTREWIEFVAKTQNALPVVAALRRDGCPVGYFTGLIINKLGCRILGSPFPGWTSLYMGFNLTEGVSRGAAVRTLVEYAFGELGCVHLEFMDRHLRPDEAAAAGLSYQEKWSLEIDLRRTEDELLAAMKNDPRRCIRKAARDGVVIQEASDPGFVDDYYDQLRDVFAKQGLVPTYPKDRVRALYDCLFPTGRLLLLRARDSSGQCLATGIFPAFNDTMFFWGGASWRRFQYLHPNDPLQWHAMCYWKARGIQRYDMGGEGEYKRKYGSQEMWVPWFRKSRYPLVAEARDTAQQVVRAAQRLAGLWESRRRRVPAGSAGPSPA